MAKLPLDDLLVFSRKAVLTAISRAITDGSQAENALEESSIEDLFRKELSAEDRARSESRWPLVVDGTAGNGVDTLFLAQAVEEGGQVVAFDVQDEAVNNTMERLENAGLRERVRLVKDSHDNLPMYLRKGSRVTAAMYNLGFLPGSRSELATRADSTVASLGQLLPLVIPGGVISVHCYTGHDNGQEEFAAVQEWVMNLPWPEWRVLRYEFCNKTRNREVLFLVCRI